MGNEMGNADTARAEGPAIARATALLGAHGETLYHYTRLETAIEKILPTLKLRMSPFSQMRDPRESKAWPVVAGGFPGDRPLSVLDQAWGEGQRFMDQVKDRFKLLALTMDDVETPDPYGRGWARARMWDRYADGGRGVCLAFDKRGLTETVMGQLQGGAYPPACGPVEYRDEPLWTFTFDIDDLAHDAPSTIAERLYQDLETLFLRKLTDWQSEHEFRFIVETDDAEPRHVDTRGALRAICLGPETPREYRPAFAELCRPHAILVAQLTWWNSDPLVTGVLAASDERAQERPENSR